MNAKFEEFLKEKRYLQNVSEHTIEFYRTSVKAFNVQEPLTQSQLNQTVAEMRESGKSADCVDAYIREINSFLTWLNENEIVKGLKVKRLKLPKRVVKTFGEAELKAIVSFKGKTLQEARIQALLCTLIDTGIRIDEALRLKRADVEFDNLLMTVGGKGYKERLFHFPLSCDGFFLSS
ncbi:MAG: phage integrase family protein [Acidobacteria bacterium]|nr:phage integrase family protein [Acidobacteriota bacterium]